ncbi:hypothetical protein [Luteolibacter sp. Populi]|uniref:hypothetical protein n=1 Tax=Luteolibacter sp. Populi TaxID=3230487 RepID=UPI003465D61C
MPLNLKVLPHQLRHWALHCSLTALPSFGIALFMLQLWKLPAAIAAMLAAIATFIALYALITSLKGPLTDPGTLVARSLKLGTRIRTAISLISIPLLFTRMGGWTPDFWCGFLACSVTNAIGKKLGSHQELIRSGRGDFLPVYFTTILEGIIISFMLLMIAFFSLLILQRRQTRRSFPAAISR